MNWNINNFDYVKPIFPYDISDDGQLKVSFNWKVTQPIMREVHSHKDTKFNFLEYHLQFITAYQFLQLNEERFNDIIH